MPPPRHPCSPFQSAPLPSPLLPLPETPPPSPLLPLPPHLTLDGCLRWQDVAEELESTYRNSLVMLMN